MSGVLSEVSDEQTDQNDDKAMANTSEPPKPDAEKPAKARHKRARAKHPNKKGIFPIVFIVILLGVMIAGGNYAYRFYLQTTDTFTNFQQSQSALVEQSQQFEDGVNKRVNEMQTRQKEMTDYIEVLREKNQHLRKDWLLMESEYLIQLANNRLLFERDINTSIVALESADRRLRETGDPGIVGVRKVIAEAVQQLKQIPQADLAGLSLQISAINKEIDKLPSSTPDPKSKAQQNNNVQTTSQNVETWSQLPSAIWTDLKGLIEIRDHEAPLQPMLAPKERFFLIENVRLQLEQARLAMLSGQPDVYKERITTAMDWIAKHFDNEASITKATLESLSKLLDESIAPPLPDIAFTYQALQKYRLGRETGPDGSAPSIPSATPNAVTNEPEKQVN